MSLLPEIEDGKIVEMMEKKPYQPPRTFNLKKEEEKLAELNNLDRPKVTEDFSDSPFL